MSEEKNTVESPVKIGDSTNDDGIKVGNNVILHPIEISVAQIINDTNDLNLPPWLAKMVKKQEAINNRYKKAEDELLALYEDLKEEIDAINRKFKTNFSIDSMLEKFEGKTVIAE